MKNLTLCQRQIAHATFVDIWWLASSDFHRHSVTKKANARRRVAQKKWPIIVAQDYVAMT
jgi:hypothetical protein